MVRIDNTSHATQVDFASRAFVSVPKEDLQRTIVSELAQQVKFAFRSKMVLEMPDNNAVYMGSSMLFVSVDFAGNNGDSRGTVTVDLSKWRARQLDKLKIICDTTLKRIGGMGPEELMTMVATGLRRK
jgi:hypothetical protein